MSSPSLTPSLEIPALLFALGMLVSLVVWNRPKWSRIFGMGFGFLGSLAALGAGLYVLSGRSVAAWTLAVVPPFGTFSLGLDGLSALFAVMIGGVGAVASLYSLDYLKEYAEKRYSISRFSFLFNLFLASMLWVVSAQNALVFLVFWELMALSSYFLVTFEHREGKASETGLLYLLVTHVGTAALIAMFLILSSGAGGSFDFSDFTTRGLSSTLVDAVFFLALFGFGAKAGIIPLHVWLPQAHPQAPSNVSALMSAVMVKTALYGLLRVLFGFLSASSGLPSGLGMTLLVLGILSAVLGALYALAENDLKRMLAFSTIENVGILFIGLGASVLLFSYHFAALGTLALFATLYHALNHAVFKALLFLGAGSIVHATHTKDLEKLGGLVRNMPLLSVAVLVGAASMAALPPLNGFAGEWLAFQALLGGVAAAAGTSKLLSFSLGAAVLFLGLTSALALAASVKLFGISFLGQSRSQHASRAHESPRWMLLAMGGLAVFCVILGLFPAVVFSLFQPVFSSLHVNDFTLSKPAVGQLVSPLFFVLLLAGGLAVWALLRSKRSSGYFVESGPTWDCGIPAVTPSMQYSSRGFSMPTLRALDFFMNPLRMTGSVGSGLFDRLLYQPIYRVFQAVAPWSRRLQTGKLVHYLFYLMVTLVGVLVFALV